MTKHERKALRATRAIAYIRVSTDEQALGPEAQRDAIDRWAKARGVTIVKTCEDIGVSGATAFTECPGLFAAVEALQASKAGFLVVAKRDRLARDVYKAAAVTRDVEGRGAQVVSAAGEGDGDDPASRLMRTLIDAFAEYERAMIAARVKAALAVKQKRGERTGGVPFGYRATADVPSLLVPDEREQAILAYARELRREGATLDQVRDGLARRGFKPRSGAKWHTTQVARMLAR